MIESGSGANGVLREMVQAATGAVNVYNALPAPVQGVAAALGAVTAAASLTGGAAMLAVPRVVAFRDSMRELNLTSSRLRGGLGSVTGFLGGPWGIALTTGATLIGLFAKSKVDAAQQVRTFTEAIKQDSGALGENARAAVAAALSQEGYLEQAQTLGVDVGRFTDAILGNAEAYGEVEGEIRRAFAAGQNNTDSMTVQAHAAQDLQGVLSGMSGEVRAAVEAHNLQAQAMGGTGDAAADAAAGIDAAALAAGQAVAPVEDLTDAQKELEEIVASFVDPLGAYTGLLQQKEEAERKTPVRQADVRHLR